MSKTLTEKETLHHIAYLEEKLLNGIKNNDVSILDQLLDDDLFFHDQYGNVLNKEMDLEIHRSGCLKVHKIELNQRDMRVFDCTVIVSVSLNIEGSWANTPFNEQCRYLRIWKKSSDWKVISASCISMPKS